ncbi:hypothetical protein ACFX1S_046324 [Malus domestica]
MELSLASKLFVTWLTTNWESLKISICLTPRYLAKRKPAKRASYSASLFDALNLKRIAYSIATLSGVVRTNPAPQPCWLDEPSTYRLHAGVVDSIF